ncbi:MAG: rhomboid family intramembrane serine protease [Chitinophagales bacterium]|nr:rhomboid family intramembrane serine protease [Chitinophagales bacterium]HAE13401.1 rhomboid family intramembrane serine protease [Bacteroidota bacterium]MCB9022849.1 rhomboid family intramembrane serine protease [Chitinophagales bacterium]HAE34282.1 rhomboid family intramembrane serine protease [Bacteroidota bacterium]HPE98108.1 rhomboid family intramembrane serine protease [Chitinophagales bacterium]
MISYRNVNPNKRFSASREEENSLLFTSFFMPLVAIALMWLVKAFEHVSGYDLAVHGIFPRTLKGLQGVLFSPFLHGDWQHLVSNSLPFLILGFLMLYSYRKVAFKSFVFIWFASGFMVWLTGRPSYHIGASNLVYGFAFFLFFSGIFRRDIQSIAMALLVTFIYGSMVWGIFPFRWEISWEGHLMGGISGAVMAWYYRKVDLPEPVELEDEEEDDDAFFDDDDDSPIRYLYKEDEDRAHPDGR